MCAALVVVSAVVVVWCVWRVGGGREGVSASASASAALAMVDAAGRVIR